MLPSQMTNVSKYISPTPWQIYAGPDGVFIMDANGDHVCVFTYNAGDGEQPFNHAELNAVFIAETINKTALDIVSEPE